MIKLTHILNVAAFRRIFATFAAMLLMTGAAFASEIFQTGGVAINGYDPVAYFTDKAAVPGKPEFATSYKGAKFQFASASHRALFIASPEKYAPQYGGFCAYATALGRKASTEPEAFEVVNNKLYLNFSKPVQEKWQADKPGFIQKGDQNWPTVSKLED